MKPLRAGGENCNMASVPVRKSGAGESADQDKAEDIEQSECWQRDGGGQRRGSSGRSREKQRWIYT
jgi:hypothetical protein